MSIEQPEKQILKTPEGSGEVEFDLETAMAGLEDLVVKEGQPEAEVEPAAPEKIEAEPERELSWAEKKEQARQEYEEATAGMDVEINEFESSNRRYTEGEEIYYLLKNDKAGAVEVYKKGLQRSAPIEKIKTERAELYNRLLRPFTGGTVPPGFSPERLREIIDDEQQAENVLAMLEAKLKSSSGHDLAKRPRFSDSAKTKTPADFVAHMRDWRAYQIEPWITADIQREKEYLMMTGQPINEEALRQKHIERYDKMHGQKEATFGIIEAAFDSNDGAVAGQAFGFLNKIGLSPTEQKDLFGKAQKAFNGEQLAYFKSAFEKEKQAEPDTKHFWLARS